jgi:hypothetical protein
MTARTPDTVSACLADWSSHRQLDANDDDDENEDEDEDAESDEDEPAVIKEPDQ